jgi:hypothetical protein
MSSPATALKRLLQTFMRIHPDMTKRPAIRGPLLLKILLAQYLRTTGRYELGWRASMIWLSSRR